MKGEENKVIFKRGTLLGLLRVVSTFADLQIDLGY